MIAFQSRATTESRARYIAICEAYVTTFPSAAELEAFGLPLREQMVTVWPLQDDGLASSLNEELQGGVDVIRKRCGEIVDQIDLLQSQEAIAWVERECDDVSLSGDGPYLLAWSVTQREKGGCAGLRQDLSNVTLGGHATRQFQFWRERIERRPELWRNGWSWTRARLLVEEAADFLGAGVLELLRAAGESLAFRVAVGSVLLWVSDECLEAW